MDGKRDLCGVSPNALSFQLSILLRGKLSFRLGLYKFTNQLALSVHGNQLASVAKFLIKTCQTCKTFVYTLAQH